MLLLFGRKMTKVWMCIMHKIKLWAQFVVARYQYEFWSLPVQVWFFFLQIMLIKLKFLSYNHWKLTYTGCLLIPPVNNNNNMLSPRKSILYHLQQKTQVNKSIKIVLYINLLFSFHIVQILFLINAIFCPRQLNIWNKKVCNNYWICIKISLWSVANFYAFL